MLEDSGQATKEIQEQDVQTSDTEESVDYKNLYLHEVQNAKKLRKRSQDSEKKLNSFEQKAEEQRISQLKENDEYKALSDELQAKLDAVTPFKEKWESHESQTRESLLSKVPEADREFLKEKDIQTLEYIVSKQENLKNNVTVNANSSRGVTGKPVKNFADKGNDLKGNWSAILDSYKN